MPFLPRLCLLIGAIVAAPLSLAQAAAEEGAHWSYSGETGPAHWAALDSRYAACAGGQQSPIDLSQAVAATLPDIRPAWTPHPPKVENNGHTIQANAGPDNSTAFGDQDYQLLQVHWHHKSEHTVDGRHAPLEAHFVHRNEASGEMLVLGVLIAAGKHNVGLQTIWDAAPVEPGTAAMATAPVDWQALLPEDRTAFHYYGSLTTPPCTEIVHWVVFQQAVTAAPEQIARFAEFYQHNNRPVQPHGRRFLLQAD